MRNGLKQLLSVSAFTILFTPLAMADYYVDTEALALKAEVVGEHKVNLEWSGYTEAEKYGFITYAIFRSFTDSNLYDVNVVPYRWNNGFADIKVVDDQAWRGAYYRVCALTRVNKMACSNVVWAPIKNSAPTCDYYTAGGQCTSKDENYTGIMKRDWEAVLSMKENYTEAQQENDKQNWEHPAHKQWVLEQKTLKKEMQAKATPVKSEVPVSASKSYSTLDRSLDVWVLKLRTKLEKSSISSAEKIKRLRMVKARLADLSLKGGKYEYLAIYLNIKIEAIIDEYETQEDVLSPLDDIFKDL